ncbi:MAG: FAD-dependent monooxygenase, partial [Bacteroidia bacterium]|nr:FAD-dependent monooxygenase [Bacteroidia bacterium]
MKKIMASDWAVCEECNGLGKKNRVIKNTAKKRHHSSLNNTQPAEVTPTKFHLENCLACAGKGIIPAAIPTAIHVEQYPHVAIIGGGIGGVALALACLHRG